MDGTVNPRRRYHSPARQEQARRTRARVLDAAAAAFVERGYAATTMRAVAAAAGVSVQTVEGAFGTKANLLKEVVDVSIAGDLEPVAIMDRPVVAQMRAESDMARMLTMYAAFVTEVSGRFAPVAEVVRNAAAADPALVPLWTKMQADRRLGAGYTAQAIAGSGVLRPDLDVGGAADIVWTMTDPALYAALVGASGWAPERFSAWLADSLAAMLLG
jgi:AcrR family transcriptional regulator